MIRSNISDVNKTTSLEDYQDKNAITEVLGCLINDPQLLKTYPLRMEDFVDTFHRTLFAVIHNMVRDDATDIQADTIEAYLKENYPVKYNMFTKHNGTKYMENAALLASPENFKMNYNTVRKWSLLRELVQSNIDVSEYFNPDDLPTDKETEIKRDKFENDNLETIIAHYKTKVLQIANIFNQDAHRDSKKAGGLESFQQVEDWKTSPDFGMSYASQLLTTVTYGLRRKRFSVMSAPSGTGKTRISIANMCFSYAPYFWNSQKEQWEANPHGTENSALYIGTEMELLEEVEPIIWAYMADVPEDHITQNEYAPGEEERVRQAIEYLRQKDENGREKKCGIYMEYVPEYDIGTLETVIEEHVTLHNVSAVFFDYIHSTPQLLAEYSQASKGNYAMREDQALSNLSTKLKELTRTYNISIDTCTQVSGDYKNTENYDESIVRGARSIIDKCDVGIILTNPTQRELEKLAPITRRGETMAKPAPNVCLTVYKNRGGRYGKVKIWLFVDYHTMRVHDLFATNKEYTLLKIDKSRVIVDDVGKPHVFTNTDAMEQFRQGKITEETLEKVSQLEKEDPSYKHKSREDLKMLKQAEAAVADESYIDHTSAHGLTEVDDDFDADVYNY